jgi:hypothetical protein
MALIKCIECGAQISDKATACVKCGCPLKISKLDKPSRAAKIKKAKKSAPIPRPVKFEYFPPSLLFIGNNQPSLVCPHCQKDKGVYTKQKTFVSENVKTLWGFRKLETKTLALCARCQHRWEV